MAKESGKTNDAKLPHNSNHNQPVIVTQFEKKLTNKKIVYLLVQGLSFTGFFTGQFNTEDFSAFTDDI